MVDTAAAERLALRAAFGDRPAEVLPWPDGGSARHRWLTAVVWGARGRYAAARALLDPLCSDRAAPAAVRAHAMVTRAAHLRQLGGHAAARRWDARGLAVASGAPEVADRTVGRAVGSAGTAGSGESAGLDLAAARSDALIGLAADSVGLGELETADRLLSRVERDIVKQISWRPSVRVSWVRAELALCRQRPAEAAHWAARAVDLSRAAGALRHEIKSELVLVVSESTIGISAEEAAIRLNSLVRRAGNAGLATLEWVIFGLLAEQTELSHPARAAEYRESGLDILRKIRRQADPVGRWVLDCSPWVPDLVTG